MKGSEATIVRIPQRVGGARFATSLIIAISPLCSLDALRIEIQLRRKAFDELTYAGTRRLGEMFQQLSMAFSHLQEISWASGSVDASGAQRQR